MISVNGKAKDVVMNGNHVAEDMDVSVVLNGDSDNSVSNVRQTEILRCFAQYLLEKNYKDTYEKLVNESGVVLENHNVARLRESVLCGNWVEAEEALSNLKIEVNSEEHLKQMQFLILEQRILEAMEDKNFIRGVELLRERLTPMNLNRERVHQLATCLMYKEIADLHNMASWKGKYGGSREILVDKLQGFIPAQVMLPPKRLESLFNMAIEYQLIRCPYHNSPPDIYNQSLLQNHNCGQKNFPSTEIQTIKLKGELWICKFSPDGKKLIVGGKENNLTVFNVDFATMRLQDSMELSCRGPINFIVWSWDSTKVAATSGDEYGVYVFDVITKSTICTIKINEDEQYNCAAFLKDNRKIVLGSLKGVISIVDIYNPNKNLAYVDGYRAQSLVSLNLCGVANDYLLVGDTHRRIRRYEFGDDTNTNGNPTESAALLFGGSGSGGVGPTTRQSSASTANIAAAASDLSGSTRVTSAGVGALSDPILPITTSFPVLAFESPSGTVTESIYVSRRSTIPLSGNAPGSSESSTAPILIQSSLAPHLIQQWSTSSGTSSTGHQIWPHHSIMSTNTPTIIGPYSTATTTSSDNNNINTTALTTASTPQQPHNTTSSTNVITSSSASSASSSASSTHLPSTNTPYDTTSTTTQQQHQHNNNTNTTSTNPIQLPYNLIRDETLFEVDWPIQFIVLSKNNEKLLVALHKVGLCLWHIPSRQILQRFVGGEQSKYSLMPSFGGYNEEYIVCGSETGYVCIWNQKSSLPVHKIQLYNDSNVNCVHWNPENVQLIAAVNDAGHVYLIGPSSAKASSSNAKSTNV